MGLPSDTIVGIQMPNIVENLLTFLGVLRAGMIAAPLPLLWRRAEAVAALARLGAKALVTCARAGAFDHCRFGMHVAAEVFCMRYVCGFGANLPDGVVPFDDLFAVEKLDSLPAREHERQLNPAAYVAAVTWDVCDDGLIPVARNHLELLAGGLAVLLESRIGPDVTMISALSPSSFAGISLTITPWLLSGGTLMLHHPFDRDVLARQRRDRQCDVMMLPGPLLFRLAEAGALAGVGLTTAVGAWRALERLAGSPTWRERDVALVDVAVFGETGLYATRRGSNGKPAPVPLGPVVAPRSSANGVLVAELARTESGTVAFRGPMVPRFPFPPGAERAGLPAFKPGRGELVDTGYTCRIDAATQGVVVTGPPPGIVSVGGYRFLMRDLQEIVGRIDGSATLAALPDSLLGHRLIGNAPDRDALGTTLAELGLNPLVVAAFHDRRGATAA
jgi:hypothetical protein